MLLYATADRKYYDEHAGAFLNSAEHYGMEARIDLIETCPQDFEPRAFYACARFLNLPSLLNDYESIWVVDIDSIFNRNIDVSWYDLGVFFRHYLPNPNMKVLCSASYFTRNAKPFAERVASNILNGDKKWLCDQRAVWDAYLELGDQYKILKLNRDFVNFDFDKEAPIWTAKGIYRKSDPVYLARKAEYAHQ